MTREEYLGKLREQLEKFGNELQQEIMEDYNQHFVEGQAEGRSDEEIIQELGNIEDMIRELRYTEAEVQPDGGSAASAQGGGEAGNAGQGAAQGGAAEDQGVAADQPAVSNDQACGGGYKGVVLKTGVADIVLVQSEDSAVHVEYRNDGSAEDKMKYEFYQYEKDGIFYAGVRRNKNYNDGTQRSFSIGPTTITFHNNFNVGSRNRDIVLIARVPEKMPEVKVETSSGDIEISKLTLAKARVITGSGDVQIAGVVMEKLEVTTASGDITANGAVVETQSFTTASGDVDMLNVKSCKTNITTASGDLSCVSVTAERIDAKTVSGDMDVKADAGQYHLVTASGDMNLWTETVPEKVEVSTASGDISLLMKKVEGAEVKVNSRSGDISINQKGNIMEGRNGTVYTFGDGACKISASTASGDVDVTI